MEFGDYLAVVRARWSIVAASILGMVAVVALITLGMTSEYRSDARLFIVTNGQAEGSASDQGDAAMQRAISYVSLFSGRTIASRVVQQLSLDATPATISHKISASLVPQTAIIQVSATDPDPHVAQQLAQAATRQLATSVSTLEAVPGTSAPLASATVVQAADLPTQRVSPRPVQSLVLAVALGTTLGFALAVAVENLASNRVDAATGQPSERR